jgi:hypothetical protein
MFLEKNVMIKINLSKTKKFLQNPKKQHKSNIPDDLIVCKPSYDVIIKLNSGEPACVSTSTMKKLIEHGWGLNLI